MPAALARQVDRDVVCGAEPAGCWIVVAAFNEGSVLGDVLEALRPYGWRIVVVDDGSTDDTYQRARRPGVVALRHATNLGQGAALRTGIEYALAQGAQHIATCDADGQHGAQDVAALLEAVATESYDVALGSRFLGTTVGASPRRRAFLRGAVWVSNRLSGLRLTDAHCGLRAFTAAAARELDFQHEGMAHASEILHLIRRRGLRYVELPVTILYTQYSTGKGQSPINAVRVLLDYLLRRPAMGRA